MARFSRLKVLNTMIDTGLVPVFYHPKLEVAREAAQSASGRSQAVSRQLAELQTQYAAVAGLRDQYLVLQRQLALAPRASAQVFLDGAHVIPG